MKVNTRKRKKARKGLREIYASEELAARMFHILTTGKKGLDSFLLELGTMMAEALMDMEREERSGPEYVPRHAGVYKWAYQPGSIYCGDQKIPVRHPRLRGPEGEIPLATYETLKKPGAFSEELLDKVLRGISERRYGETVVNTARAFGVSPSSVSRRIIEVTTQKLKGFKERDLSDLAIVALFIDTIHRAGEAFLVALGLDESGHKHALGFWQGATENHEICEELLIDLETFGVLLDEHWRNKKRRSAQVSDPTIDRWYDTAKRCGALGGKIMGAGGGGFFMFYCSNGHKACLRKALTAEGLREKPYDFDYEGAKVLVNF